MKKPSRPSMDGFVRRQPGVRLGQAARPIEKSRRRLGDEQAAVPLSTLPQPNLSSRRDIDRSLREIDDEEEQAPRRRFFHRRRKHVNTAQHSRRRKIIKRTILGVLVVILLVGGYFGWKLFHIGGLAFDGNIFGVFQHQRLKEDANGRTNILIFGTSGWSMSENNGWDGALLTDSIMVVSLDQDDYSAYTISLPRDLYVGTCTATGKLNEVYYCAHSAEGKHEAKAAADFQKMAGEITGLDIQYYAHANWTALSQGVNAVGGVDLKIESDDPRGIYDVATGINYKNGEVVHLNGERALALARARNSHGGYGLAGGNFDREKNQQRLLAALQKKATSASVLANPVAVNGLLDTLGDNLRTNFKTTELQALLDIAKNNKKVTSLPFVGREGELDLMTTGMYNGISIVQPTAGVGNYTDIHTYIKRSLMGEDAIVVIDVLNGSGVEGVAKTKADELEAAGYIVGNIGNAPQTISGAIKIYQLDEEKTKAADVFTTKYGVTVNKKGLNGYTPSENADFIFVIGK